MEEAKDSRLSFTGFRIKRSVIDIKGPIGKKMNIGLEASGEIKKSENKFHLKLNVHVSDENEGLTVEVDAYADYKLDGDIEDPKYSDFLYLNAPAILFPYIRAYISALTALSGIPAVTLPPVNISGMKEILQKQTLIK
ncbi:MAG: protein-export chaperone SecB [Mangrovibacterium sp.]